MTSRPTRIPAARPDLPKAPTTGHPARRPHEELAPIVEEVAAVLDSVEAVRSDPPAPVPLMSVVPKADTREEQRVNFGARVRESVRRRARLWAVQQEVELQDLLDQALDEYLTRRDA